MSAAHRHPTESAAGREMSHLQVNSVKSTTRSMYFRAWMALLNWLEEVVLPHGTEAEMDASLVAFFDYQYFEGEHSSLGQQTLASVTHFRPEWGRQHGVRLAQARQALRGWRRLAPPRSRLPTPWEVVCMITNWFVKEELWDMGVACVMAVIFYLRPREAVQLRVKQLVPPLAEGGRQHARWCLILCPEEVGQPNKTGQYDISRPLDLVDHQFFAPVLETLRRRRALEAPVFNFTYPQWAAQYRRATQALQLEVLGPPVLYGLRHAGASLDVALSRRSLMEVQKRGGWAATSSVRRYEKAGRVTEQLHLLPAAVRERGFQCAEQIGEILLRRCIV